VKSLLSNIFGSLDNKSDNDLDTRSSQTEDDDSVTVSADGDIDDTADHTHTGSVADKEEATDDNQERDPEADGMLARRKVVPRDTEYKGEEKLVMEYNKKQKKEKKMKELVAPTKAEDDNSSVESWNHMTKVDQQTVFPFTSLVCMPDELRASVAWGLPNKYIQFSNFSSSWRLEVNWIDEDGAMVSRTEVKAGTCHFELCSSEHVWALVASPLNHGNKIGSSMSMGSSLLVNKQSSEDGLQAGLSEVIDELSPVLLVFRPSPGSLQTGKCASLLWSPWSSLSIAQSIASKSTNSSQRVQPCVHIQLFDPSRRDVYQAGAAIDAKDLEDVDYTKLMRKPLRISKKRIQRLIRK
jgi:hypothetical protein